jgi:hypothetical protein
MWHCLPNACLRDYWIIRLADDDSGEFAIIP